MKRWMKQIIFLAVCAIPYVFLTMLGDFLLKGRAAPPLPLWVFLPRSWVSLPSLPYIPS